MVSLDDMVLIYQTGSPWSMNQLISPKCRIYASVNRVSNVSDNGMSPIRHQAIIWTNTGLLAIGPLGTNFSEILIKIQNFSFTKMHLKISSAKWRPFCPGRDEWRVNWKSLLCVQLCYIQSANFMCYGRGCFMMTSSNGNTFRVTGHLCGEFTGQRWIPRTMASDAELWCFLWSTPQ